MNFTHLFTGGGEPPQGLLQKYEHFAVLVVVDDEMETFVKRVAGFEMRLAEKVLCQIIRPADLRVALPGSFLYRISQLLKSLSAAPDSFDHSFLAVASREELMGLASTEGIYVPLMLNTLASDSEREVAIRNAILDVVRRSADLSSYSKVDALKTAATALSVVSSVFRFALGLPK